ncbi:HD family hydrolase [Alphaproteobacteria bacterium]|jgi:uncharacterized protein|nr:HD family hydrolase [Alphaproteobacteria bacterium]MDA9815975.1 HD family hydrolase [Alphaproteobacteria bacterium]MDC0394800.1 HD family hydrolase [Alphaproteobacteria bacterium]
MVYPTNSSPRAWQRMLSGRRLNILEPSPLDIEIEDIAHGLSRVARWNGQTSGNFAFSVAQHSILVEQIMHMNAPMLANKWRLACLLHDAPEYVIGDMITPLKSALGLEYPKIDEKLQHAIHIRFGLPAILPEAVRQSIKRADKMAAWIEATQIAGFSEMEAGRLFPKPRGTPKQLKFHPESPKKAKNAFIHRARLLGGFDK